MLDPTTVGPLSFGFFAINSWACDFKERFRSGSPKSLFCIASHSLGVPLVLTWRNKSVDASAVNLDLPLPFLSPVLPVDLPLPLTVSEPLAFLWLSWCSRAKLLSPLLLMGHHFRLLCTVAQQWDRVTGRHGAPISGVMDPYLITGFRAHLASISSPKHNSFNLFPFGLWFPWFKTIPW